MSTPGLGCAGLGQVQTQGVSEPRTAEAGSVKPRQHGESLAGHEPTGHPALGSPKVVRGGYLDLAC